MWDVDDFKGYNRLRWAIPPGDLVLQQVRDRNA